MKVTVLSNKGTNTSKIFTLNPEVFENQGDKTVLRQALHVHTANTRAGTAVARGRALVSGTGKKLGKNNKMGRARHGDARAPLFRGGGVAHGPVQRNFGLYMPEKMKKLALELALTDVAARGKFKVVEDVELKGDKLTKAAHGLITDLEKNAEMDIKRIVIYAKELTKEMKLAFRNLQNARVYTLKHMNPYDLLSASDVIVFESAMEELNGSKAAKKEPTKKAATTKTTTAKTTAKVNTKLKGNEK